MKQRLFLIFYIVLFSGQLLAKDLEDAVAAMRVGDFAEAYCIMQPLAQAGDADAQYNIGWMYLNGYGLRTNENLALEWWQKASEQGHADANFSIAMLYDLGDGDVREDHSKAIDYYLLAANDGQDDAIAILKSMMLRGDKSILGRMHSILEEHGKDYGVYRTVKARKLNARRGPSVNDEIITQLLSGQNVLELFKQGKWSQVALLEDTKFEGTVWVYNPLLDNVAEEN